VDVVIVGAGISGVGSAFTCSTVPDKSYVILEIGHLRRHMGNAQVSGCPIRLRPLHLRVSLQAVGRHPIASAKEILKYMGEVIDENGIAPHIRSSRIPAAAGRARTICGPSKPPGSPTKSIVMFTCSFLWMCQGYYDHESRNSGLARHGQIQRPMIHAQLWDPKIDYTDKRVMVIGSGATAATGLSRRSPRGRAVTMLQRSPTYLLMQRNKNELADRLRQIESTSHHPSRGARADHVRPGHDDATLQGRARRVSRNMKRCTATTRGRTSSSNRTSPPVSRVAAAPGVLSGRRRVQGGGAGKLSVVTDTLQTFTEKVRRTVGRRDRSRHRRRRDGLPPLGDGRHSFRGRRQARETGTTGHLSRHDVHRRAEPAVGVRIFPCELDVRSTCWRFRLQPAENMD
jgi:cation diffusion facilitator CzcD-associated flavoprotein CzcO